MQHCRIHSRKKGKELIILGGRIFLSRKKTIISEADRCVHVRGKGGLCKAIDILKKVKNVGPIFWGSYRHYQIHKGSKGAIKGRYLRV